MERFLEKRLKACVCLGGKRRIQGQASRPNLSPRSQFGEVASLGNLSPTKLGRCSGRRFDPIAIKKITDEQTMKSASTVSSSMGLDELPHQQVNEEGMLYIDNGRETEVFPQPSAQRPQYGSANHTHDNDIFTLQELLAIPDARDSKTQNELVPGNGDLSIPGSSELETEQSPAPEPHAQSNSTEADQPSPVSLLQITPSDGEIPSGTETFEAVHSDHHDSQGQDGPGEIILEAISENDLCTSSDVNTGSKLVYEQRIIRDAIRESAYILDVLRESGFEDGFELDDISMPTWYASQSPLDPWLFNTLEKKYGDNTTWSRLNRRHLFDRINKVLFEMFRSFVDPQLSVKDDPDWVKYGIVSEVKNLLWIEEKSAYDYKLGMGSELNLVCPDFEDEGANMIATELEKLLMDDLIDEIVNTYME